MHFVFPEISQWLFSDIILVFVEIYDVFQYLPANVQVCLFSATMPIEILGITSRFMRDPVKILVKKEQLTLDGIKQFYVAVEQ